MSKIIAMIPCRMGSKRIPKKNIRLLAGKPLVAWIIEAAKSANCFDEIWLNSEDLLFQNIADQYGIKFYKRPETFASDQATNDDFTFDFLKNNKCEYLVQLLATSPFITPETIYEFTNTLLSNPKSTVVSVKKIQIECVLPHTGLPLPVNFKRNKHTLPSQELTPVLAYACGLMGWQRFRFMENYAENNGAYHGGYGNTIYYPVSGYEMIDIDTEGDFSLAEAIIKSKQFPSADAQYYDPKNPEQTEVSVPDILKMDGIINMDFSKENKTICDISDTIAMMGDEPHHPSWAVRLINTASNSAALIKQNKGEGNRLHYHNNWDEWWLILSGEWEFRIERETPNDYLIHKVFAGEMVFIPRGKKHKITATGEYCNIRLAVSRADVEHIYVKK